MKSTSLTILFNLLFTWVALAQILSEKTNELALTLKGTGLPNTGPLPTITWIYPALDFTNSGRDKIDIHATVESSIPLQEIKLLIGNAADGSIFTSKNIKIEGKTQDIQQSITLPNGSNFISIEAQTREGVIVSASRRIMIGKNAMDNIISIDRKDHILLLATDKYDYWDDLVNPIDDAHTIAQVLKETYGFQVDLVEDPTVEKVWEKMREYNEKKYGPQDQLLIFFAGHGQYDESFGEGYVVAKNSLKNDLSKTTYISHNRLRGVINNIPCNHILLTMDVCFGGTLDPIIARSRAAKDNEVSLNDMLIRKFSHKTRKYLTSGGKEYVSDGIPGKHSPFAEKFIESLRTLSGDGVLTLAELQSSLEKLKQLPRFGSFGDDESLSDFVFVGRR
jgi:Caspase domain